MLKEWLCQSLFCIHRKLEISSINWL